MPLENTPDPQGSQSPQTPSVGAIPTPVPVQPDPTPAHPTPAPSTGPAPVLPPGAGPAQPPPPAAPAYESGGTRDLLARQGYDVSGFESDQAALDTLLGAADGYRQNQPFIEVGQQAIEDWDAFQAWKAEQGHPEPSGPAPTGEPAAGQEPEDTWSWDLPEFDPAWNRHLDANGQIRSDTDIGTARKIEAYYHQLAQKQQEFFRDPREVIRRAVATDRREMETAYREMAANAAKEEVARYHAEQESDRYIQQNLREFYELDERGQPRRDLRSGQPVLTAKGKAFASHAERGRQLGITDPAAMREYASAMIAADEARGLLPTGSSTSPPSGQTPGPNGDQRRQTFLDQAIAAQGGASRDGTLPDSTGEPPQDPSYRTPRQIVKQMEQRGEL